MIETLLKLVFAAGAGSIVITYLVYPLAVGVLAKGWPRPIRASGATVKSATAILAARDEGARVGQRIEELMRRLDEAVDRAELIVVSDGSTDATASEARRVAGRYAGRVVVIEWDESRGKAAALTEAAGRATGDILVLADARQRWGADAIERLLEPFVDPEVGGVSGQLLLEKSTGELAGVGLYWRFEKWLRASEARFGSQVGVTGAICAVRRPLFPRLPEGLILDDVYWPLSVVMAGRRVVNAPAAVAYDRLPPTLDGEFRRKLRTQVGVWQLVSLDPRLLAPNTNPLWLPFVLHKVMRLVCPWGVLAMILSGLLLWRPPYAPVAVLLLAGTAVAALGTIGPIARRSRLLGSLGSLLMLQIAAWCSLGVWLAGASDRVWRRSSVSAAPPLPDGGSPRSVQGR